MAYIGNRLADSYTSFAKQDFTTSATTSYTLDNAVTNENEIALFINFVRQEPTTAYTASGTSLTLTSATSASDDMYCVFLGKALQTVNPPAGSVGLSQLSATGTKDSTTFLRGDNTFSTISAGITEADEWRLTTSFTGDQAPISSNLERKDSADFSVLGTGMTESSGIFTFPSTGYWFVMFKLHISGGSIDNCTAKIVTTTDNFSTTINASNGTANPGNSGQGQNDTAQAFALIDVTDTSNVKVRFDTSSVLAGNTVGGNTDESQTSMIFIRLGDT